MISIYALTKKISDSESNIITLLSNMGCHSFNKKRSSKGEELRFALPNHNNSTSGVVYLENLFCVSHTPSLEYSGSLIGFVQFLKGIEFGETIVWICNKLGISMDSVQNPFPQLNPKPIKDYFARIKEVQKAVLQLKRKYFIDDIDVELFEIDNRRYVFGPYVDLVKEGISVEVQKKFNIGFDLKTKRILFPHRFWNSDEEKYVGIIGRTTNKFYQELDIPKYFPLISYPKRKNLYGLWENLKERKPKNLNFPLSETYKTIHDDNYIVIYEAEKSVLKRATWNDFTGVALCGHELQPEQIRILNNLKDVKEIIFALDKDISEDKVKEMCNKIKLKRTSYMIDRDNLLGPTDSPADARQEIWWKLFATRIKNY